MVIADSLLWVFALIILGSGIGGHYYFASQPLLFRVAALLVAVVVALLVASKTGAGKKAKALFQEATTELRKVVWPTKKETTHSTIAVLCMVFVMGLVLWAIDAVLIRVFAWMIGLGEV